jgi:hypothetical protein
MIAWIGTHHPAEGRHASRYQSRFDPECGMPGVYIMQIVCECRPDRICQISEKSGIV